MSAEIAELLEEPGGLEKVEVEAVAPAIMVEENEGKGDGTAVGITAPPGPGERVRWITALARSDSSIGGLVLSNCIARDDCQTGVSR